MTDIKNTIPPIPPIPRLTPAEKQALAAEAKERALTRRLSDARLIEEALAVAQRAVVMRYVVKALP